MCFFGTLGSLGGHQFCFLCELQSYGHEEEMSEVDIMLDRCFGWFIQRASNRQARSADEELRPDRVPWDQRRSLGFRTAATTTMFVNQRGTDGLDRV